MRLDEASVTLPMHSRAIEQRTEVVRGRVYIHPLPQLLDNIGYLIVCVPPKRRSKRGSPPPILGVLVDCGDADSVLDQIDLIRDVHYANIENNMIEIYSLLCTHKHHDHTAGNRGLLKSKLVGATLKNICGGAIEKVPYCNTPVADGDFIKLPSKGNNDMGALVEIECLSVPSHTRGSTVYVLRNKVNTLGSSDSKPVVSHLFTGDAMFSGGGGVPFESDFESNEEKSMDNKTIQSQFKPNGGSLSIERCFAKLLRRSVPDEYTINSPDGLGIHQMLVFPGHEYTIDLLQRQMQPSNLHFNSQWNRHQPSIFFELASQYFVAGHRRNLPKSTKLLTVPSSMRRELKINPYFRSLHKRGELLLTALTIWYKHLHKNKKSKLAKFNGSNVDMNYLSMPLTFSTDDSITASASTLSDKTPSSANTWNVNHDDFNRSVFTTVYTNDLEEVVHGLKNGRLTSASAAKKLTELSNKLDEPTVMRRPIPNTLPSDKKIYMGLLALAVLGSDPSGLCTSDSRKLNLPAPVGDTDHLLISKRKLISTLFRLGLLPSDKALSGIDQIVLIINLLWEESRLDHGSEPTDTENERADFEVGRAESDDLIELGALKLTLFGVVYKQPSWFRKCCMPCNSAPQVKSKSKLKRTGAELVKHDVAKCPMCASVLGCPKHDANDDDLSYDDENDNDLDDKESSGHLQYVQTSSVDPNYDNDIEVRMIRGVSSRRKITLEGKSP